MISLAVLVILGAASVASADGWTEMWESYTSGNTPCGSLVLGNGT